MFGPILGLIAGIAGLVGVGGIIDAKERIDNAKRKYYYRRELYEEAEQLYKSEFYKTEDSLKELVTIRLNAVITLGKAVEFLKKARIKERVLAVDFDITPQDLSKWEIASVNAMEIVSGMTGATLTGLSTATAAYGLIGILGNASTGTAIASLTGVAAKNATLAWLGGGSIAAGGGVSPVNLRRGGIALGSVVLGSLIVGPAILAGAFFAQAKTEKIETEVAKQIAEMDVAEAKMSQQITTLKIVQQRVEEVRQTTIQSTNVLDHFLSKLSRRQSNILLRIITKLWRFNVKLFTGRDLYLEEAYYVARLAKSLGEILDVPILDEKLNDILNNQR